jgi:Kef-type K+ transport system membrane component KefB
MIGKPEWFKPRKLGWGLGVRKFEGILYIIVVAFIYGALFASPLGTNLKTAAAVVFTAVIIIDLLHIMYVVYSNLDEREERHQLVAERNASFTAVALITIYLLYVLINAALTETAPPFIEIIIPVGVLLAMSLAKGGTLLLLEREG